MQLVNEMSERKKLQNKWLQQQTNKTINVINEMKKKQTESKTSKVCRYGTHQQYHFSEHKFH